MAKKTNKPENRSFVFRKHANIGAADAIDDKKYLSECFVNNGELEILIDLDSPKAIVVGRTGSGKTALLEQIEMAEEKVIKIAPEGLALTFISNNEVIKFFSSVGVNMDLFYKLLWRHVFAVELIKEHYHIINETSRDSFISQLIYKVKGNKNRKEAIDYILKWGDKFWMDSEYRVKEVTKTMTDELGATLSSSLGVNLPGLGNSTNTISSDYAKSLTAEEKAEIVRRGQKVVDSVQMKMLSEIMEILETDVLEDKQQKYFITIDRLDENWVNEELRYHLTKALLDTVKDFNNKIQNVKIIVAIREDLLDRVFRYTRSSGYQEEKYKSMYLSSSS